MAYTLRDNGDGTADAVECDEFAEVVYEDNEVLVVNLARSLARDVRLEGALVDALARHGQRHDAELAISLLADDFGIALEPDGRNGHRWLTLAPRIDDGPSG
jgi:hypothetical protein